MITGNIRDIDNIHQFNPVVKMAMKDILANMDKALTTCCRHEVMGRDLYWYSESREGCDCVEVAPEFHDQYVDVEVVLKGQETIGYSENNQYESVTDDHILDQDFATVDGVPDEKYLSLQDGDFAIFYPGDVHRPLVGADEDMVHRAVIKINKVLL